MTNRNIFLDSTVCMVYSNGVLCVCICPYSMDLGALNLEMVEIIYKITPNEDELKKFSQFSKDKKNPSSLAENDRFLYEVHSS